MALYLLFCAWARMFDQTQNAQARQRLENIVTQWGSEANHMLASITRRIVGDEE